jgi:two-component system nitrate/nitrite response regulator NarL
MVHQDIRMVILHANRLFRETLAMSLAQQERIVVVGTAASLDQISMDWTVSGPNVLLVEANVLTRRALEDATRIRTVAPGCKVVMLEVPDADADVLACIEIGGASGYVLRGASFDDLLRSIQAVAAGETLCQPRITSLAFSRLSALAREVSNSCAEHAKPLTRREQDIIESIEQGLSNKEIAVRLGIELSTVKNHVHNILDKLKLQDRRSAARFVKEHGLISNLH